MSKHVASTAEAELSPKVKAGAWVGFALLVAQAVLTAVTPDMFTWAGDYSALFYAAVTGAGVALAAYMKRDPLREIGGSAVAAGGVVPAFPTGAVGAQEAVAEDVEPSGSTVVEVDETTAEADALAARAAAIRQGGVS